MCAAAYHGVLMALADKEFLANSTTSDESYWCVDPKLFGLFLLFVRRVSGNLVGAPSQDVKARLAALQRAAVETR